MNLTKKVHKVTIRHMMQLEMKLKEFQAIVAPTVSNFKDLQREKA
jgi:hypothetical protein